MDFWKSPKKTIKAQNEPTLCVIEQKSVAHTYKVLYINKTFVITLPCRIVKKPGPTKTFLFYYVSYIIFVIDINQTFIFPKCSRYREF